MMITQTAAAGSIEEARAYLEALEANSDTARAHLTALQQRRAEALEAVEAAEAEVSEASVQLAGSASEAASDRFELAVRKLAEAKARADAYEGKVIPEARERVSKLAREISDRTRTLRNDEARLSVAQELLPAVDRYCEAIRVAGQACDDITSAIGAIRTHAASLDAREEHVLKNVKYLARIVPEPIRSWVRDLPAGSQPNWREDLIKVFNITVRTGA
jgi:chromosome segregation ATPase